MPIISPESRTVIWIIVGIATLCFGIISYILEPNLTAVVRKIIPSLRKLGGRPPKKKPFIVWFLYLSSAIIMVLATAIASSAPEDIPISEAVKTAILPRNETLVVVFPTGVPTKRLLPTPVPTPMPAKIAIVLDVSKRMGDELDEPGVTKLDVARNAILQLLDTIEGNLAEVELLYITNQGSDTCTISDTGSRAVGFTRDFEQVRQVVNSVKPYESDQAPLTDTLRNVVNENKGDANANPLTLFIFSGGDDTCGRSVEVYFKGLKSLSVNTINFETFLILLLGKEKPPKWATQELGVSLGLARDAKEVQQLVESYGNQVASELPKIASAPPQPVLADVTETATNVLIQSLSQPTLTASQPPTSTRTPEPTLTDTMPPPTLTFTSVPPTEAPKPFLILSPSDGTEYNCDPAGICMQSVTVQWVPFDQTGNLHLSIWVKPYPSDQNYRYYVQPSPYYTDKSLWTSSEIYIGQKDDPIGTPFRIYAIVTAEEYVRDQSFDNLPTGLYAIASVDVRR